VILFGSYACSNPRRESDIDLAVISPDFNTNPLLKTCICSHSHVLPLRGILNAFLVESTGTANTLFIRSVLIHHLDSYPYTTWPQTPKPAGIRYGEETAPGHRRRHCSAPGVSLRGATAAGSSRGIPAGRLPVGPGGALSVALWYKVRYPLILVHVDANIVHGRSPDGGSMHALRHGDPVSYYVWLTSRCIASLRHDIHVEEPSHVPFPVSSV
jgi:hypothetical protein